MALLDKKKKVSGSCCVLRAAFRQASTALFMGVSHLCLSVTSSAVTAPRDVPQIRGLDRVGV